MLLEIVHIIVRVAKALGFAEADAVDDARMVERIADHRVLFAEQRLEQSAIGIEARGIEDRVIGAEKVASGALRAPCESSGCRR